MRRDLRQRVFAAAETDLQPEAVEARGEGGEGMCGLVGGEGEAGQGDGEQRFLARPELVAAGAAVQPVGRRLQGQGARDSRAPTLPPRTITR